MKSIPQVFQKIEELKILNAENLKNSEEGETFEIIDLVISANDGAFGRADIKIPFNGSATCSVSDVEVIIS